MKKACTLLAVLLVMLTVPAANAASLPREVASVFSGPRWSGYQAASFSGYDGSAQDGAAYAVLMKKGDHNVLCLLEKGIGETEYILTAETDRAVYQGDLLPSLSMDTGSSLFFSYTPSNDGYSRENYSVFQSANGCWGPVELIRYAQKDGMYTQTMISTGRGIVKYISASAANSNQLVLGDGFESHPALVHESYMLENFDINELPATYEEAAEKYQGMPYADKLLYSAEHVITPGAAPLMFEVLGSNNGSRMDLVRIKSAEGIRQEIPIGLEGWQSSGESILFADANFDGYLDFLVCRSSGAYNLYYDCWLWDTYNHRYMESDAFSGLMANPSFDPAARQIHCFVKDGAAQYFEYDYQVTQDGWPHLTAWRDILYSSTGKRTITLWQPEGGRMVFVKQWTE